MYIRYISMHLKSQLQNRSSFLLLLLGSALMAFTGIFVILVIMPPNQTILGFNRHEVLLSGAVIMMSFSLAECFGRGFDTFPILLGNGQYDRMLVRPRNIIVQIFASTVDFTRLGRVFVSLIVLIIAIQNVRISSFILLLSMIVAGTTIFICLFIIYGALCFYSTESLEFMNILTDGAREFGKVPYSFYGPHILKFLTIVVPLACVQYYPLLILIGKDANPIYAFYPIFSMVFIIPTYLIWHFASKHYRSTGS